MKEKRPHSISLASSFPELVHEWSPNNILDASQVAAHSNQKALWICPEKQHEWSCVVHSRTLGHRCHYCTNRKLLLGYNDFATTHPHLLDEWDYEKNEVLPTEVVAGAAAKLWWKCREHGHPYPMRVVDKAADDRQCVYCSNQKLLPGFNDLATRYPDVLKEWDYEKNEIDPSSIFPTYNSSVWWLCKNNHSWPARPRKRYRNGTECPECKRKTSKGERALGDWLLSEAHSIERNKRYMLQGKLELDIFFPDLRIGIEYDGDYWHALPHNVERDRLKDSLCIANGIVLLRIKDSEWWANSDLIKRKILVFIEHHSNGAR